MKDLLLFKLLSHIQLFFWPHGLYSLPGSSVHRISQARILEWLFISFSRGSSQTRDWTHVLLIARLIPFHYATREAPFFILTVSSFFSSGTDSSQCLPAPLPPYSLKASPSINICISDSISTPASQKTQTNTDVFRDQQQVRVDIFARKNKTETSPFW